MHPLIELKDGPCSRSWACPDMRVAIQYALSHLNLESGVARLDLIALASLHFEAPQEEKFPCLGLAYEALRAGGVMPAVLNAANEVAVDLFLNGRIGFTDIPRTIASCYQGRRASPAFARRHLPGRRRNARAPL